MRSTSHLLRETDFPHINRDHLNTLQVNLGYKCNQTCQHCHVNAGPNRTEAMNQENIDLVLAVLKKHHIECLDLTGGAPELNPLFKYLVSAARELGVRVIDRCNLTILSEPDQEGLAIFLAEHQVEVTASLPCYSEANVDKQRGKGVFERSIDGLQTLNALGYGQPDSGLVLNLVYNPQGPSLPPSQVELELDYKRELKKDFGITFNQLFTITNMPIQRFGSVLLSQGKFHDYMTLLKDAYRPENLETVMCRSLISVNWQGYLYDCDFNQMLDMPAMFADINKPHLNDLLNDVSWQQPIKIGQHCYGCTAGQGSSCGGALKESLDGFVDEIVITESVVHFAQVKAG
jgi:radical SAM/Cys-rich protein